MLLRDIIIATCSIIGAGGYIAYFVDRSSSMAKELLAVKETTNRMHSHYESLQNQARSSLQALDKAEAHAKELSKEVENLKTLVVTLSKKLSKYEAKS